MNKDKAPREPNNRNLGYRRNVVSEDRSYGRNNNMKEQIRYLIKQIMRAKDIAHEIEDSLFNQYNSAVDRASSRNVIPQSRGDRFKSNVSSMFGDRQERSGNFYRPARSDSEGRSSDMRTGGFNRSRSFSGGRSGGDTRGGRYESGSNRYSSGRSEGYNGNRSEGYNNRSEGNNNRSEGYNSRRSDDFRENRTEENRDNDSRSDNFRNDRTEEGRGNNTDNVRDTRSEEYENSERNNSHSERSDSNERSTSHEKSEDKPVRKPRAEKKHTDEEEKPKRSKKSEEDTDTDSNHKSRHHDSNESE